MKTGFRAIAILAAGLVAQTAAAGGYAPPPPEPEPVAPARTPWEGVYVGPNIGYAFTDNDISAPPGAAGFPVDTDPDGLVGGAQVGYNFRSGNTIYGLVGDFTWMDVEDTQANPPIAWRTEYGWTLSLRGRVGFLANENTLIYGHGGVAYAEIENTYLAGVPGGGGITFSDQEIGYIVGAGAEMMATQNMSVFAEYSFMGFDDPDSVISPAGPTDFDNDPVHQFKLGLNFHF